MPFNGGPNRLSLLIGITYNQSWNFSLEVCTGGIIIPKTCSTAFHSITNTSLWTNNSAFMYDKVNISVSPGGQVTDNKTAWYLKGYRLQLNVSPDDGYQFAGYHYSNGTLISNNTKYPLIILSPMNISA